jgi:hypothetical protein
MALLAQALALTPGPLLTTLLVGNAVGLVLVGPRWSVASRRLLAALSLVVIAAAYPLFVAGPVGAFGAAFVLGVTASGWAGLSFLLEEWRERLGVGDLAIALVLFGSVLVTPVLLGVVTPLLAASLPTGLAVLSAAAVVGAAGLWLTVPAELPDRARPADVRLGATLLAPLRTFRLPVVRTVALLYGAVAVAVTAFDGFWRAALAGAGASDPVAVLVGFSVVGGGALTLAAVLIDRMRAGSGPGLIERNPAGTLTALAGLLAAGGLASVLGAALGPAATILTIAVAAYLVEAGAVGTVLPVQAVIRSRVEPAQQGMAMTAVTIAKFAVQVVVSIVGTLVWSGATPLAGGWSGIAVLVAAGGVATVAVARLGWRTGSDAASVDDRRATGLPVDPPGSRPRRHRWWPIAVPGPGPPDEERKRWPTSSWATGAA